MFLNSGKNTLKGFPLDLSIDCTWNNMALELHPCILEVNGEVTWVANVVVFLKRTTSEKYHFINKAKILKYKGVHNLKSEMKGLINWD